MAWTSDPSKPMAKWRKKQLRHRKTEEAVVLYHHLLAWFFGMLLMTPGPEAFEKLLDISVRIQNLSHLTVERTHRPH